MIMFNSVEILIFDQGDADNQSGYKYRLKYSVSIDRPSCAPAKINLTKIFDDVPNSEAPQNFDITSPELNNEEVLSEISQYFTGIYNDDIKILV